MNLKGPAIPFLKLNINSINIYIMDNKKVDLFADNSIITAEIPHCKAT
jgi:hypothetical protein